MLRSVLVAPFGHGQPSLSFEQALEECGRGVSAKLWYRIELLKRLDNQFFRHLDLDIVDFIEYRMACDGSELAFGKAS